MPIASVANKIVDNKGRVLLTVASKCIRSLSSIIDVLEERLGAMEEIFPSSSGEETMAASTIQGRISEGSTCL